MAIEFGSFRIDLGGGLLLRDGEPIFLRPKTWGVLLHLTATRSATAATSSSARRTVPSPYIYLQSQAPGGEQESNWLPTAVGEGFYLVLRTYGPKPDLLDRKWAPPAVRAVE